MRAGPRGAMADPPPLPARMRHTVQACRPAACGARRGGPRGARFSHRLRPVEAIEERPRTDASAQVPDWLATTVEAIRADSALDERAERWSPLDALGTGPRAAPACSTDRESQPAPRRDQSRAGKQWPAATPNLEAVTAIFEPSRDAVAGMPLVMTVEQPKCDGVSRGGYQSQLPKASGQLAFIAHGSPCCTYRWRAERTQEGRFHHV